MAFSPGKIYPGANLTINVIFTDDLGDPVDPASVVFKASGCGGGNALNYTYGIGTEVQRNVAGEYLVNMTPTSAGRWWYRWEGVSLLQKFVKGGDFVVTYDPLYDDYDYDSGYWS